MATELPRDTLHLFAQKVSSDCGGNRKKCFFSLGGRRQFKENLQSGQRWSRRCRPGFWSILTLGCLFQPTWCKKKIKGLHEKKNTDDFSGTPKWCFIFINREDLSMRTWMKLAPKLPAAYENPVLEFHSYVINLWKTYNFELSQIKNMDDVPLTFDVPPNKTGCQRSKDCGC